MRERYKNALMWGLYAALVLLVLVLQTVSFGRPRFFGVKLCFVPVLVACVSERGRVRVRDGVRPCLDALRRRRRRDAHCAFGALRRGGGVSLRPVSCAEFGFRTSHEPDVPSFLPAGSVFVQMYGSIQGLLPVLAQVGLSLLLCPPVYLAAWAIRKAGA